jgi:hypothetical protein
MGGVEVPLIRYRPESSTIPFTVEGEDVLITMDLPRWQTHSQASFGADCLHNVGKIRQLHVRGSYLYFSEVHPDHVEALSMSIDVSVLECSRRSFSITDADDGFLPIVELRQLPSIRLGH